MQGVLVVQTAERRPFSPNETRMLVTAASQLAPLVTGARLLEQVAAAAPGAERRGRPVALAARGRRAVLRGCALSPGAGLGAGVRHRRPRDASGRFPRAGPSIRPSRRGG